MSKKVSTESSNVFDLTALKLLMSVVAISLASMMSRASTMPTNLFSPSLAVSGKAKMDLLLCPVPYRTEYYLKDKANNSCESRGLGLFQSLKLTPFSQVSTKPYCAINRTVSGGNES